MMFLLAAEAAATAAPSHPVPLSVDFWLDFGTKFGFAAVVAGFLLIKINPALVNVASEMNRLCQMIGYSLLANDELSEGLKRRVKELLAQAKRSAHAHHYDPDNPPAEN